MGLKGDIDELKEVWEGSSILFKVGMGLSVFLTISSVTSLSDAIFKWKGFVLDAVEFYRTNVADVIHELFAIFDVHYTSSAIDFQILFSIFIVSFMRRLWLDTDFSKKDEVAMLIIGFVVLCGIYARNLFVLNGTQGPTEFKTLALILVFLLIPLILKYNKKAIYYLPFGSAIVFVFILGAINAGLNR